MASEEEKLAIGIDLGGSHVAVSAVDRNGKIVQNNSLDIDDHAVEAVFDAITKTTKRVLDAVKAPVIGVGIGSPGNIDPSNGAIRYSPNFGWHDVPLGAQLTERLKLPVFVANDARCATLGEYTYGVGQGTSDFVLLTLGTGIGGGIIANGKLMLGHTTGAGEVGHHQIRPTDGFVCGCGKIGCFEAQASGMGLIRHARAVAASFPKSMLLDGKPDQLGSKAIRKAAENGDGHAAAAWKNFAADLALGIANVIAFVNPETIALGGGVSSAGEYLLHSIADRVDELTTMSPRRSTKLVIASLGNDAGMIGAATMVFHGGLLGAGAV